MKINRILQDADGSYSTTKFSQILAVVGLTIGFVIAVLNNSNFAGEIALALSAIAIATPATKGWVNNRYKESNYE